MSKKGKVLVAMSGGIDSSVTAMLLHEQGYTINGARQKLSGEEAEDDSTQANQLSRQIITELEDILAVLKA